MDFIKIKNLGSTKDTAKKIDIQVTDWEKTFAMCKPDKDLYP